MRALVLSGGGVKGSYQVGVLKKWLFEEEQEYDIFSGVSVGALNSAILAQIPYGNPKEAYKKLADVWGKVGNPNIRKDWRFFGKIATLWKGHVYNTKPLQEWVKRGISEQALRSSGKKLMVGATSLDTGKYRVAREDTPDIWKWVYASSAFPLFFDPGQIDGQSWVDGGVRNVTPIGEAIRAGATEIDVILAADPRDPPSWGHRKNPPVWQVALRVLDILMAEVTLNDLQVVGLKNDLALLGEDYKVIQVRLIHPEGKLVDNPLDFDPKAISEMRDLGYQAACLHTEGSKLSPLP